MSEEARQLARCVVVIPALDPDGALPGYAAALLERGAEGVVAVDDGSRPSCRAVFEELEKLTLGGLRKAVVEGDTDQGSVLAGQIAGMVNRRQSCREIIDEIMEQAETLLKLK